MLRMDAGIDDSVYGRKRGMQIEVRKCSGMETGCGRSLPPPELRLHSG